MKYSIRIQDVYNSILNETEKELVVVQGIYKKVFVGALFFELDAYSCVTPNIHKQIEIDEANGTQIVLAAYELLKEFDMLKKGTLKTMAHWQYINGVTTDMMIENYSYENDEEYYVFLKEVNANENNY